MAKVKAQEYFQYYFQCDDLTFICWQLRGNKKREKKKRFIENKVWVH